MADIRAPFRLCDPRDKNRRHGPQAEVLDFIDTLEERHKEHGGIQYLNYVGGRGCGKTTIAMLVIVEIARRYPDLRTAWSARSGTEIDEVLLSEMEDKLPQSIYQIKTTKNGARYILWATGHKTHLVSRNVDNSKRRRGLGLNVCAYFHDEAATGFNIDKFTDMNNGIRGLEEEVPFLLCMTTSTPLPNAYQMWCQNEAATTIYASSYDSPFLSKANLDSMAAMMDEATVQQELMGRFVITTGRMWDQFVEAPWPDGNILEGAEYDPSEPFFIGGDLGGGQSAFQIVQYFDPLHPVTGRRMFDGKLACIVVELTPSQMGLEAVMGEVIEHYCDGNHVTRAPVMCIVGHDVEASSVLGPSGAEYFKHLGWDYT
ncbi:MAG: terminase large subunit domain-containing protein, partial [Planctomycetota bacterium]